MAHYSQEKKLQTVVDNLQSNNEGDILLVDGDIVAYRFAYLNEDSFDWGDGITTKTSDLTRATNEAEAFINHMCTEVGATEIIVFFTPKTSYRKLAFAQYKENRDPSKKPECLGALKEALGDRFFCITREYLEADDLLGMFATHPDLNDRCTIATLDKDLDQIPCWHYNWSKEEMNDRFYLPTPEFSRRFLWKQVLMGDTTDNYKGAYLAGPQKTTRIVGELHEDCDCYPVVLEAYLRTAQDIANKLEKAEEDENEKAIAKLTALPVHDEAYMKQMLICAKMLQYDDYDWVNDDWQLDEREGLLPNDNDTD